MCSYGDDHDYLVGQHIYAGGPGSHDELTVSRRDLLRGGAAAVVAGAATALFAQAPVGAQAPAAAQPPAAPGVNPNANGGVIFWGNGNPGNIDPKALLAERQGPTKTS